MTNTANKPLDWYAERTAYLSEFMSEERRQVLQRTLDSRTRYMTILTENTYHAQNASALVRHCEAFGVQDIHTIENRCKFNPNVNIVRGTDKWIDLHRHRTTAEAIADLKGRGYRIVATTPHREDKTPETFDVAASPFVLVFGTEHAGISDEIVAAADEFLRIPMCGMVESLNVSASAAILIYMLSSRMRETVPDWRLTAGERAEILYRWTFASVRAAEAILRRKSRRIRKTMNTILRKQFLAHVGQTSPEPMMIEVARAEGVFFYTPEGKRYYDLVAGVSVSNVGHANPRVVEAVQRQAADYMHIMVYGEMIERPQVRYAARIAELLPGELSSVYFVNSGAEAIEGALKLAKRYTHRTELVSMRRAYHGSTQGAMSLMGEPEGEEWKGAFRPLLPDVRAIDFNDFDQLRLITRRTACVVVEPVQGEAGVRPPVPGWLEALRRRCDEVGALLVFDEIQTGMGRTGEMFAMCKYGVTPDIVCLAKAFGGGMPLGAFVSRKEIMDTLQTAPTLGHITTFGGHPVCCAAGLAALEYLLETGTVEHVEGRGVLYESLLADHPQVVEIRRSGLLLAVELGSSAKMFRMMELFKEAGILSDWFLYCDTAFRISPPLTITEEEVRDSARLIRECLDRI